MHGTEQYIIIVVRDKEYSFKSRVAIGHCSNIEKARIEEERIDNRIINDAIRTYILEEEQNENKNKNISAPPPPPAWAQHYGEEDLLWDHKKFLDGKGGDDILHASLLPARINVILVSYEAMMEMKGDDYVQQLYNVLGIESDHIPVFKDENAKYKKLKIEA